MGEMHPGEMELARFGEEEANAGADSGGVAQHLRWCARCRSAAADYGWLQGELGLALTAAAAAVPVPRPRWWAVQERLLASQRRQIERWHASAFATVVLAVCLMLSVPNFLSPAVAARIPQPEAMMVPAPVTAAVSSEQVSVEHSVLVATPTPVVPCEEAQSCEEVESLSTPGFVPPPTPPQPDTLKT